MKKFKTKKCKNCGTEFTPFNSMQKACNQTCALELAVKEREKKEAKQKSEEVKRVKRDLKELDRKSLPWQHKQTQKVFNKMRKLQELLWFKERGLKPECISCGKTDMDWCCGHLKTVGAHSELRYDETNSYLQCNRYCNMGLSGNINGNKATRGYIQGLKDRFGEDRAREIIQYVETRPNKKWTWQEVEEIRKNCNAEIRRLEKCLSST